MDSRVGDHEIDGWARRAQRGDELALERLLRAVRPRVFRWALIYTGSPDDAEDVAQAALLRAQSALAGFGFHARVTTWLYSITRSVAADARRTRRRRTALLATQVYEAPRSREESIDSQRLVELVRAHFAQLPVRQREVFDLVDLQGHTPAEVAEMLALNPATVRVHLLRARRTVRERMLQLRPALVADRKEDRC